MSPTLTTRPAQPADRPTLVEFMAELQEFERALYSNRTEGYSMAEAHLVYLEELVRLQNGQILVAEQAGQRLGFLVCFIETLDDGDLHVVEAERRSGFISDLYVIPAARGQGVGKALLQAAEAHFRDLGLTTIQLTALFNNHTARRVYDGSGYELYEVVYAKRL